MSDGLVMESLVRLHRLGGQRPGWSRSGVGSWLSIDKGVKIVSDVILDMSIGLLAHYSSDISVV